MALWNVTKKAFWHWLEDDVPRLAAALTFYTLFSLAPTLVIVVGLAASVVGERAAREELSARLSAYFGARGAEAIVRVGESASQEASGLPMIALAMVFLAFTSTIAFSELHGALNSIWQVRTRAGLQPILRGRFMAFLLVLGLSVVLVGSVVGSAVMNYAVSGFDGVIANNGNVFRLADTLLSFGLMVLSFTLIYRFVPDTEVAWHDVWKGALLTAALFSIGRELIAVYMGRLAVVSVYGAAASIVAVLLWIYYSTQVFLFGAEWTRAYAHELGSRSEL